MSELRRSAVPPAWLTPDIVARLGSIPDAVLAETAGRSRWRIAAARRARGIPSWDETRPTTWYERQLERAREQRAATARAAGRRPGRPGPRPSLRWDRSVGPVYEVPDGDPVYAGARAALAPHERNELGTSFDAIARDLMQEFALAAIEGRDPHRAVEAARRRANHERIAVRHGVVVGGVDITTGLEVAW